MLEVNGQSLAQHLVNVLHAGDVAETLLVRGGAGGTVLSPSVAYADVIDSPNMLNTLQMIRSHVRDRVVISYCDILVEPRVLDLLLGYQGNAGIVVDKAWQSLFSLRSDNPLEIAESCRLAGNRLVEIGQPLAEGHVPEAQYLGLMVFSSEMFAALMKLYDELDFEWSGRAWRNATDFKAAYFTDFLQEAIERGFVLVAICAEGGWLEFDTPRDLELGRRFTTQPVPGLFDPRTLPPLPSVLSAGGVAVRGEGPAREVLLAGSGQAGGWRIPKGMLDAGEGIEAAACREVFEETGVPVRLDQPVDRAEWTYDYGGRRWHEQCYFHKMTALSNVTPQPDSEHSVAAWLPMSEALSGMQYPEEQRALSKALSCQ